MSDPRVWCSVLLLVILINQSAVSGVLILSVGDKCDTSGKSETVTSRDSGENSNDTIFGVHHHLHPPICDPSMPLECISGRCQCKRGFTISSNGTKCLEIARNGLDSYCQESIQCWKGLLGRLSECRNGRCQCYESETLSIPIVFHQGRCYYGESLGDFCQIDGLCEATTPNAECRTTCQCREGFIPSWDKSRCLRIAVHGLNSSCEENVQCEKSILGPLSECDSASSKCQCYRIPMVPTVFHSGRCYFGAALGDVCQVSAQCIAKTRHSSCGKDGKCHCLDGYVPSGNQTLCLQIPSADSDPFSDNSSSSSECVEDVQCTKALGYFARCNLVKRRCECVDPRGENETSSGWIPRGSGSADFSDSQQVTTTAMVIIGSKCQSVRQLGQSCKYNKQCSTVTPSSVCLNGICECREETHVPSLDGRKCLKVAKDGINSPCDEDLQCTRTLGPLAGCSNKTRRCECSSILPVVYYERRCYFHRQLGSPCETHTECLAGGNFFAECRHGRCRCKNGTEPLTDHSCTPSYTSTGSDMNAYAAVCVLNSALISLVMVFYI